MESEVRLVLDGVEHELWYADGQAPDQVVRETEERIVKMFDGTGPVPMVISVVPPGGGTSVFLHIRPGTVTSAMVYRTPEPKQYRTYSG